MSTVSVPAGVAVVAVAGLIVAVAVVVLLPPLQARTESATIAVRRTDAVGATRGHEALVRFTSLLLQSAVVLAIPHCRNDREPPAEPARQHTRVFRQFFVEVDGQRLEPVVLAAVVQDL